jgi:mono/diheme cytochrome c family protein
MSRRFLPVFLILLLPLLALSRTVKDGVYSKQQADRGKATYGEQCAKCHGESLNGGEGAPELSGKAFVGRWSGNSVGALFGIIHKTMPTDDPGNLSTRQAADLTAYILSSNGFPAGDKELENSVAALNDIKFDAKQ